MALAIVSEKGDIIVPKEAVKELHLHPGDKLHVSTDGKLSTATLFARTKTVDQVSGMLSKHRKRKPLTVEEMDENIAKAFRKGKGTIRI